MSQPLSNLIYSKNIISREKLFFVPLPFSFEHFVSSVPPLQPRETCV